MTGPAILAKTGAAVPGHNQAYVDQEKLAAGLYADFRGLFNRLDYDGPFTASQQVLTVNKHVVGESMSVSVRTAFLRGDLR